jgi:micrococcal nuclease
MGFVWARLYALFCLPLRDRKKPVRDDWKDEWHYAHVVSVYDGDTLTVVVYRHGHWVLQTIRLAGIDTPELRTKDPKEKELAEAARQALSTQVLDEYVWIHCQGREKYGRILAEIYPVSWFRGHRSLSYNQWLLNKGYAQPYDGGKKGTWKTD